MTSGGQNVDLEEKEEKIDIFFIIRFLKQYWRYYLLSFAVCSIAAVVCFTHFDTALYKSTAVLYYPEQSASAETAAGSRELMDDAVAVMQEQKMLSLAEERTQIPWKEIQRSLAITGNAENGLIEISYMGSGRKKTQKCMETVVSIFCEDLPRFIPTGELIVLTEPELEDKAYHPYFRREILVTMGVMIALPSIVILWRGRRKAVIER